MAAAIRRPQHGKEAVAATDGLADEVQERHSGIGDLGVPLCSDRDRRGLCLPQAKPSSPPGPRASAMAAPAPSGPQRRHGVE